MKRFYFLLITILALTGCAPQTDPGAADKPQIVATIFPAYDFARNVAGDKAAVSMLLKPGAESHSYEPTPRDIIKIQNCAVFIYTGGESDEWVAKILASMDTGKMRIIKMLDCVPAVEEEIVEGMEDEAESAEADEHEHAAAEPEYDEHVWTAPKNAQLIVQKIADTLCAVDTPNAAVYRQNAQAYTGRLRELDAELRSVVNQAARKTLVFGDRFPFRYFTDAYGLKYFAAFPGCSTETEASAATVKFLIDKVRSEKIPVVFHIEFSNRKMAATISEATGAQVRLLHSVHNVSRDDLKKGLGYIDLMRQNITALKEALQ
ncbi:MAG: metal ABC transporter substrate-binding protein [Candidatus Margulisbacteria bacterium]|jgi:zinc transport system substrate-binding protein|nr:metal ABC transporter substrate-binding protein [Candidatus Margulisiibacteriota bacterium]